MRRGSYAVDEFGQGIVDPDYRLEDDDSPILCPGSEYHGPPYYFNGLKLWDKQSRERAQEGSVGSQSTYTPLLSLPTEYIRPGSRTLRFYGPFSNRWQIDLEDERIIEEIVPGPNIHNLPGWPEDPFRPVPIVRDQRLTVEFDLVHSLKITSAVWVNQNRADIDVLTVTPEGFVVDMKPIVIPFSSSFTVYTENLEAVEPDWVEFQTSYQIERHPWFMELWGVSGTEEEIHFRPILSGFEPDYDVIDEVHYMTNERG